MAEINNNIPKFQKNIERVDVKKNKEVKVEPAVVEEKAEQQLAPATDAYGKALVINAKDVKGVDIAKSVDEAVALARTNPARLTGSESIFNTIYQDLLESGVNEEDAYIRALQAEEEFLGITAHI